MNINDLIAIVKKKLQNQIALESILIEDKSFLHKNHAGNQAGKFHLKISLVSKELKQMKRIDSDKKIYKILNEELKKIYSFYSNFNQLIHFLRIHLNFLLSILDLKLFGPFSLIIPTLFYQNYFFYQFS